LTPTHRFIDCPNPPIHSATLQPYTELHSNHPIKLAPHDEFHDFEFKQTDI